MKKNFKRITLFCSVLLVAVLLISSCAPIVDNSGAAYLEVEKGFVWKSVYQVGEELSFDGLIAKYYSDFEEQNNFEIVILTSSMISGFDTSKEGNYTMTVTYKGKTATVDYTVVAKATQFEINKTFCIGKNTFVSVDSSSMKATVKVFDNYFKVVENQPSKTEEQTLSYAVNNEGKNCASFTYGDARYDIFYDMDNDQYYMMTVSSGEDFVGTSTQIANHVDLGTLQAPQKNSVYKSELQGDTYYSIKLDDDYNAVITKHTVDGDVTVDTVMDSFTANESELTSNGLLRYSQSQGNSHAYAMLSNQGQFKIRKTIEGKLESEYSVICLPVA